MYDETQNKIINAAMKLIMERGYSAATTKDIAIQAGVNECTIFRKFKGKKEIVLSAMDLPEWNPKLSEDMFMFCGDFERDLISFSKTYMKKVTPEMVKLSIGLRTPELFSDTAEGILKVPQTFKKVLVSYFTAMGEQGKTENTDYESMAMMFLSMNFGFVFLDASFGKKLTALEKEDYIKNSVQAFLNGIKKNNGTKVPLFYTYDASEYLHRGRWNMVYFIAAINSGEDNGEYMDYVRLVKPIVESYGGRYLLRSEKITALQENWKPKRAIIIEWDSKKQLEACFNSAEYRKIAAKREKNVKSTAIIAEG